MFSSGGVLSKSLLMPRRTRVHAQKQESLLPPGLAGRQTTADTSAGRRSQRQLFRRPENVLHDSAMRHKPSEGAGESGSECQCRLPSPEGGLSDLHDPKYGLHTGDTRPCSSMAHKG